MKTVYSIFKYDLIGTIFYSYEVLGEFRDEDIKTEGNKIKIICPNGDTRKDVVLEPSRRRDLSFTPKGVNLRTEKFLPYFADVTQDINPIYQIEPKTFKNCQLMTEKYGEGYLQFFDHSTKEVHRIAMNSNYYIPITDKVI